MIPETPRGFKDVLPGEAAWRKTIEERVQDRFASWGYMPIETPTLEVLGVMDSGGGVPCKPITLFDEDGKLLALRPDVTLPIARMVASRLQKDAGPFRFRYTQQVFREQESLQAQSRELTQLGCESIGLSGVEADAEVISLLVGGLEACGLKDFTVALGTVGVLHALVDGAGRDAAWKDEVLRAYHTSNYVALDRLAQEDGVKEGFGDALSRLTRIRGGREAIEECADMAGALGCEDGLGSLLKIWDLLEVTGVARHVIVDFSVMSSFHYYTGFVVEAFAPGVGLPLGGGGRYDHMLEAYGRTAPAAGFAFSLERVMDALVVAGMSLPVIAPDAIVCGGSVEGRFLAADNLRQRGLAVCMGSSDGKAAVSEAQRRGIRSVYAAEDDGGATLLYDAETGRTAGGFGGQSDAGSREGGLR